jgi:hypothetical protein
MELLEHNRLYAMEKREVDEMIEHKVSRIISFFRQKFDAKFMPLLFLIFFSHAWDPT